MLSLNNALEQYVFAVASKYIRIANSEEQSQFVELVGQIGCTSYSLVDSAQPGELLVPLPTSCLSELQQEWEKALNKQSH